MHLLIRYTEKYPQIQTLDEHSKVLEREGAVWFGRMGRVLADKKLNEIKARCDDKNKPFLYLARLRSPGQYFVYRGSILDITNGEPKEKKLIPDYYKSENISPFVTLWIKLSELEQIDATILNDLVIAKSGNTATDALKKSVVSLFVVRLPA